MPLTQLNYKNYSNQSLECVQRLAKIEPLVQRYITMLTLIKCLLLSETRKWSLQLNFNYHLCRSKSKRYPLLSSYLSWSDRRRKMSIFTNCRLKRRTDFKLLTPKTQKKWSIASQDIGLCCISSIGWPEGLLSKRSSSNCQDKQHITTTELY